MTTLIEQLAAAKGIASEYVDAWGQPAQVSQESKAAMLGAMGYQVDDEAMLTAQLEQEYRQHWLRALDPVMVVRDGEPVSLEIRLPIDFVNDSLIWALSVEQGGELSGQLTPVEGELVGVAEFEEMECQAYRVTLDAAPGLGYHQLVLLEEGNDEPLASMRLIVAPKACYKQAPIAQGRKVWGPSVQLYCLRSRTNWGIGDFSDLGLLVERVAGWGAHFVGLNPIHALYPANPESASPYSPSSRRWLNLIYIDVEAVPEFQANADLKAEVASPSFQQQLTLLRAKEYVDYSGVTAIKLPMLRKVFDQRPLSGARLAAFDAFVAAGGDSLQQQASFDAIQASLYAEGQNAWGWPVWPEALQDYHNAEVAAWVAAHSQEVNFYLYLQFLADEQLAAADARAKAAGMVMGIYRDLAVGVSEGSTEIWANRELYCPKASVGAPPDILGPLGQNWGLPPMNPNQLFEAAYQPMVDMFRANMRSCGALRIDHVMALLRLWWVPPGASAAKGAYIYYPVDDLLGILALESHRNQCLLIGEDLGTVPQGIDVTLKENGVHSYKVFFFERSKDDGGYISPAHYTEQAMSALTTHDMPTLKGFWHCDDLALGKELGLYPDEAVLKTLYADRHQAKQCILDSLHGHGVISPNVSHDVNWVGMNTELNHGLQIHMSRGSCALFSTQLEDWLEMDKPVNVPGTSYEYPNWRRKLSADLEDLFERESLKALAARMSQARDEASR
ncbi:4-alpha-glucanotransferase [Aeromonas molluscorum]|uniref:4-alpha-glucanotransferase n=1 Tax=Aeromonas molluscorum 848 TaxID=1268236 RepID=R1F1V6_9GAMM|nr:4-alpha-glucanotransferase [Aeromonas molluscorum]EOD53822.1 4-alpha-glucanotransferase [Aeromonas molluscorum 848]